MKCNTGLTHVEAFFLSCCISQLLSELTGSYMIIFGVKSLFFNLESKTIKKQKTECSPKPRKKFIRSQTEKTPAVPPMSKAMEDSIKNQRDNSNLDVGSQPLVSFIINCERKCRGVSRILSNL